MNRGGGRFSRIPQPRWSAGGGRHHHPYRGCGPGFGRGFGGGFHGFGRDNADGGNFIKLFIGAVPSSATEADVRPLFEEHGDVIEVAFIKDRRTGQQQTCCFVNYATVEGAERAIGALHNQYTLPGGSGPIQVRYADRERQRLGAIECKLFVGALNKEATVKEIEEIFSLYGPVEDVFILRDDMKQSRGCCFVKLRNREMATAAIIALHGTHVMSGCDQPLIVRFAYPKKPRPGEFRGGPAFGNPGFHPRPSASASFRTTPTHTDPLDAHTPNSSCPISPQSLGPSSQIYSTDGPADPTSSMQSSLAVSKSSSSHQVHQLEQIQTPVLPDAQSSIQENTLTDAMQFKSRVQEQGTFDTQNQQQLPTSSTSQHLTQPPLQQSPSSHTHEVPERQSQCSGPSSAISSVSSTTSFPLATCAAYGILCQWSEHTCPDGFRYYYNCITQESWWEKPQEYAEFEQQQILGVKHLNPQFNHIQASQ